MKIFHILAGKANPDTLNGVNKVVHSLATEQNSLGYDVTVVGIAENNILRHQPKYRCVLFKKHILPFLPPPAAVTYLLQESEEDSIFHFHSAFIPWFLPLINILICNNRKHIFITPHGAYADANMTGLFKLMYFHLVESRILKAAERVHLIGYQTETTTSVLRYARDYTCIPNGYNVADAPPLEEGYTPTIGALCRLSCYQKGLDLLIPAFAEYKRSGGKYNLKLAGGGADEARIQRMIRNEGLQNHVSLVGVVYGEEKWKFLRSCIAHISPSRFDVIPTACLESAYMKCIQLTAETTNLGKYVRQYQAGTVIETPTIAAITHQLMEFDSFSESVIRQMRDNARRMVVEELNWAAINNQLLGDLYRIPHPELNSGTLCRRR